MKKVLIALVALLVLGGGGMGIWIATGTNVRQLTEHGTLTPDGKAKKSRTADALDYAVAVNIAAPAQVVWDQITDAAKQAKWNSTLVKIEGPIALGSTVKLVAKTAPERTFELKVTTFDAPKTLVWEDGGKPFMGVRTITLTPDGAGTRFAMNETLSGRMLSMIEPKLPDFAPSFETYAADLKKAAEAAAPPPPVAAAPPADAAPADAGSN
jgi:uncharacterized protein YndB with AHSA1/START domain